MILYSYVFMYNLKNDNCTTMIENRLNDFQRMTEAFHGYLSQKITSRNLSVIKVIIQDLDR